MPSNHPIQNAQFSNLMHDLEKQKLLYSDAVLRDEILAKKKEIRLRIKELEAKLNELNQEYRDAFNN